MNTEMTRSLGFFKAKKRPKESAVMEGMNLGQSCSFCGHKSDEGHKEATDRYRSQAIFRVSLEACSIPGLKTVQ
jgi:hypothetical protein